MCVNRQTLQALLIKLDRRILKPVHDRYEPLSVVCGRSAEIRCTWKCKIDEGYADVAKNCLCLLFNYLEIARQK